MTVAVLDLNPRVRDIIKTALAEAKPLWLGLVEGERELWPRKALWMVEEEPEVFRNTSPVQWGPIEEKQAVVDGIVVAITRNGPPFRGAPIASGTKYLLRFDSILIPVRGVELRGQIPRG